MKRVFTAFPLLIGLLAGCQYDPPVAHVGPIDEVYGQIAGRSPMPDRVRFAPGQDAPQDVAPVSATGRFSLPLPTFSGGQPSIATTGCEGNVVSQNASARFQKLDHVELQVFRDGVALGTIRNRVERAVGSEEYLFVYTSAATTVRGSQRCPALNDGGAFTETYDLTLPAGWTVVRRVVTADDVRITSVRVPTIVTWS
ncbi:hypothetical protein [Deinococcus pimensis]|uniref:hypothetical protein n=1 Tax=Deinococcus pimensis TaxID=309888 RepID=UPI0004864928|nr:hypothetical protein [Deinococcus pimensis]